MVNVTDPLSEEVLRRAYLVRDEAEDASAEQLAKFQSQHEPD